MSLPVGECGLKFLLSVARVTTATVTPRGGVWIEIIIKDIQSGWPGVTPRGGVWIEICGAITIQGMLHVTPRGGVWIEIRDKASAYPWAMVTPRGGVWIEIYLSYNDLTWHHRHSPWGSVD